MSEKLTEEERMTLSVWCGSAAERALRIIDAQAEALTALEAQAARDHELAAEWKALAEARQIDLRVLEAECERLRAVLADVNAHALNKMAERNAAEAECERLRAELPEIKSQKGVSNG